MMAKNNFEKQGGEIKIILHSIFARKTGRRAQLLATELSKKLVLELYDLLFMYNMFIHHGTEYNLLEISINFLF